MKSLTDTLICSEKKKKTQYVSLSQALMKINTSNFCLLPWTADKNWSGRHCLCRAKNRYGQQMNILGYILYKKCVMWLLHKAACLGANFTLKISALTPFHAHFCKRMILYTPSHGKCLVDLYSSWSESVPFAPLLSVCVTPANQVGLAWHGCQLSLASISAVPDSYECCERDD